MSLFEELGVFTRKECRARQDVGMDNYIQVETLRCVFIVR